MAHYVDFDATKQAESRIHTERRKPRGKRLIGPENYSIAPSRCGWKRRVGQLSDTAITKPGGTLVRAARFGIVTASTEV